MIDDAVKLVRLARRPVSLSGAGLSAESGLETFRGRDPEALWSKHDPLQMATPEAFEANPQQVTDWYAWRRKVLAQAEPNAAHRALASRESMLHVTQNVDDLLERAGAREVIHLHGTIGRNHCAANCGHEEAIDMADPPPLAPCPTCGKWMRPSVVWFGESLPEAALEGAIEACVECDLLLVIGTSATVNPAASLIPLAKEASARVVLVNTEETEAGRFADVEIIGKAGEVLPKLLG